MSVCDVSVEMSIHMYVCVCACVRQSSCCVGASSAVKLNLCAEGSYSSRVATSEHGTNSQLGPGRIQRHADGIFIVLKLRTLSRSCHIIMTLQLVLWIRTVCNLYLWSARSFLYLFLFLTLRVLMIPWYLKIKCLYCVNSVHIINECEWSSAFICLLLSALSLS